MVTAPRALLFLPVTLSLGLAAQDPPHTPDPHALLLRARQACLEIRDARYTARYEAFGVIHPTGVTVCDVRVARPDAQRGLDPRFWVNGTRTYADRTELIELRAAFDGEVSRRSRGAQIVERRFAALAPGQEAWALAAGELGAGGNGAVLWSLVSDQPFSRELANSGVEYEGRAAVNGVLCEVLYVPGDAPHKSERLFLGVEDHLPRKREQIGVMYTDRMYGSLLTIEGLEVDVGLADDAFQVSAPDGYEVVPYREPIREEAFLALGASAPDWTLSDPEGNEQRLSDLRGRVVVLDFWGTWCGPCVRKLPEIQKLADALREKPVDVLALSCVEPPNARPRELMERMNCHVPLLLHGETICEAYGVTTFPTVYVIGVEGNVLFRRIGGAPAAELEELILKHLEERGL